MASSQGGGNGTNRKKKTDYQRDYMRKRRAVRPDQLDPPPRFDGQFEEFVERLLSDDISPQLDADGEIIPEL